MRFPICKCYSLPSIAPATQNIKRKSSILRRGSWGGLGRKKELPPPCILQCPRAVTLILGFPHKTVSQTKAKKVKNFLIEKTMPVASFCVWIMLEKWKLSEAGGRVDKEQVGIERQQVTGCRRRFYNLEFLSAMMALLKSKVCISNYSLRPHRFPLL